MKFITLFLLICSSSFSADLPFIRFIKGKVTVYSEGKAIKAKKGLELKEGDIVETGKKSFALLKFPDLVSVKIDAHSKVSVKKYIDEFKFQIKKGASFFKVDKKKENPFHVLTKTVSLAVRGTTFFVAHNKESKTSWACVNEGSVEVKEVETSKLVLLTEGYGISADKDQGMSEPYQLEWTKKLNWSFDDNESSYNEAEIEDNYKDYLFIDYE